jgi:hypothetical protein
MSFLCQKYISGNRNLQLALQSNFQIYNELNLLLFPIYSVFRLGASSFVQVLLEAILEHAKTHPASINLVRRIFNRLPTILDQRSIDLLGKEKFFEFISDLLPLRTLSNPQTRSGVRVSRITLPTDYCFLASTTDMRVSDPKELAMGLSSLLPRGTFLVQRCLLVEFLYSFSSHHRQASKIECRRSRSLFILWWNLGSKVMHEFSIPGKPCADLPFLDPVDTSPKASMEMAHADLDPSSFLVLYLMSKRTKMRQAVSVNHIDGGCGNGTGIIDAMELGCAQPPDNHKDDQPYQPVPESSEAASNIPNSLTRKTLSKPEFKMSEVKSRNDGVITAVKDDILEHILAYWLQNVFGSAAAYEVCGSDQREAWMRII